MYTTTSSNRQSSLYVLDCYFLSAMPPKYLAIFSYIYPTKNHFMIKYELLLLVFSELSTAISANG